MNILTILYKKTKNYEYNTQVFTKKKMILIYDFRQSDRYSHHVFKTWLRTDRSDFSFFFYNSSDVFFIRIFVLQSVTI